MRARLLAPTFAAALALALAACDEPDTVVSDPAPETAPTAETAPTEPEAQSQAEASDAPTGDFAAQDIVSTPAAPVPSSVFDEGVDALGEIDLSGSAVFADAPFEPGTFEAEDVKLTLDPSGEFTLELAGVGERYTGQARVYGDMMTLSNVDAPPGENGFPMTCRIAQASSSGFELHADGTSCALLDGFIFTPAG
ncbi:MAG: hypothetical protein EA385_13545 [Salinarimonadaceae bacterium]|nr:MAG: hypothetical protein EA385_13545 [Salinarimonadaceae bacterium]